MLKFDFPVYAPDVDCALYGDYLRGKDETARAVLLTVMRDMHPAIADSLHAGLSDKLHTFMRGVVQESRIAEADLQATRGSFLGALFNTEASQFRHQQAAVKESDYDADLRNSINTFVSEQFPKCLKNSIQLTHQGDSCSYLRDVSERLNYTMRTKHTSPYEFYYPPCF